MLRIKKRNPDLGFLFLFCFILDLMTFKSQRASAYLNRLRWSLYRVLSLLKCGFRYLLCDDADCFVN